MKNDSLVLSLLAGYLFLLIFRPYEYWPILGEYHIERVYMICFMSIVFLSKKKFFITDKINASVFLFSSLLLVSGVFSLSWDASWKVIADYLKYVVFYLMVILCVRDSKDFRYIILVFILVMFLYVGKSVWEFFVNGRYMYRMGIARMVGIDVTYGHPNSFAASICYSLPLTWAMIRSQFESVWLRRFLWTYGCLAFLAIVMTGSRSGMVTSLLFLLIILLGTSRKFAAILLISIAITLSWQVMPDYLQTRFLSTFVDDVGPESARASAEGRMIGFNQGISLFIDNPILGVGPGNYPLSWDIRMNAHNIYGQLLGELGLLGLVSFGFLLILIIIKNRHIIKTVRHILFNDASKSSSYSMRVTETVVADSPCISPLSCCHGRNFRKTFFKDLGTVPLVFYSFVAKAIIQTIILLLFKGWGDHNLYRYTWLWLAALTVLGYHFFSLEIKRYKLQ